ncbi:hypothetical protein LEP1GSC021_3447 [Leptospira noguchii str. 1993005606]|nr:hypothetical protein LEP1GSC021_3447 [Leptospira noguchii str. 1993005606]
MNNFYRQFISHITVVYVVVLSHDITGGAIKYKYSVHFPFFSSGQETKKNNISDKIKIILFFMFTKKIILIKTSIVKRSGIFNKKN